MGSKDDIVEDDI